MVQTFDPINTALLLVIALVLGWYLKDRFGAHDKRFDAQDEKINSLAKDVETIKTTIAGIEGHTAGLEGRIDELSREVGGMRSDMVQIALAVGARARPEPA